MSSVTPSSQRSGYWREIGSRFRAQDWAGPAIILLAAFLATLPLRLCGFSAGHDFNFHFSSWLDVLQSWRQGILYPHWAASANFGTGEPRFVFYPPLTWMLGALLGTIFQWHHVPLVLTFLLLAGLGLSIRTLAREVVPDGPATLAGCFGLLSAYALFTVYERSAYAELAGAICIPLLLKIALQELKADSNPLRPNRLFHRTTLQIALVIAAAWLCDAPVGVIASYLFAVIVLAVAIADRSWMPIFRSILSMALGLGLAAFYLVPAAYEQRWANLREVVDDPGLKIENSFLFARHANPALKLHDVELFKVSCIVVVMVGLALAGIALAWYRRRMPGPRRWWMPLALIPLAVLLLQLPLSLPLWNLLPKLHYLQFPWRLLIVLEAPMGIFLAAALWTGAGVRRKLIVAACTFFFIASSLYAGRIFHQIADPDETIPAMLSRYHSRVGFEGTDEYAPPAADNTLVAMNLPDACLVQDPSIVLGNGGDDSDPAWAPEQGTCQATFRFEPQRGSLNAEHKRLQAHVARSGYLLLRLRRYPAWSVLLNGHSAPQYGGRDDGLMAIAVPAGSVDLRIDWSTTRDERIGRTISLASIACFAAILVARRRSERQLG